MPEQIHCPECQATLRVPEDLLGKNVKCPKCQTTFLAELDRPAHPEGVVDEPAPSRRRRPSRPADEEDEGPPPDDEPEDDYEERPRRRRRRPSLTAASSSVSGPASALMVVGGLDVAFALLRFLAPVLGISVMALEAGNRRGNVNADFLASIGVNILLGILSLVLGILILFGAVKMKQMRSYGLAMTACILAMIPCVNCCLLGLPFGIWGLVVLNKPEVKDAFS